MAVLERVGQFIGFLGKGSSQERLQDWVRVLTWAVVAGFVVVALYALTFRDASVSWGTLAAGGLMLAGASLLVGGVIGFLFGIPRTLQGKMDSESAGEPRYQANTNLEQISDWLTKILVGVGLTQMASAPAKLRAAAEFFSPAFSGSKEAQPFAMAIMVFFVIAGFLFAYLWTRLYLASAMAQADTMRQVRKEIEEDQSRQASIDARALSATRQQLSPQPGNPAVDPKELHDAIVAASPSVKVSVFYEAWDHRSKTWRENKEAMERAIPIFRALIDADPEHRFHKNYGQLGFALKDKPAPDWAEAERMLTEAIRIRGPWQDHGWIYYEMNRAICRIEQDAPFKAGQPSAPEARERILDDLRAAAASEIKTLLKDLEPVPAWMKLNKVKTKELEGSS